MLNPYFVPSSESMDKSKKSLFLVSVHRFWWHNPVNALPYDSGNY
jgi:hypothetical protein